MCPENPLQNSFSFPYKMVRFGAQKLWCLQHRNGKTFSNLLFTTEWYPRPHFLPHNGGLYGGQPHPFGGGNGKGDMNCSKPACTESNDNAPIQRTLEKVLAQVDPRTIRSDCHQSDNLKDLRRGTRERCGMGIGDPNWSTLLELFSWKWPMFFFDLQQQSSSVAWCLLSASCTARLSLEIQNKVISYLMLLVQFCFWDLRSNGILRYQSLVKLGPPESEDSSALSALSML